MRRLRRRRVAPQTLANLAHRSSGAARRRFPLRRNSRPMDPRVAAAPRARAVGRARHAQRSAPSRRESFHRPDSAKLGPSCPSHPSASPNVNAKSWSAKGRAGSPRPRATTSIASLAVATSILPSSRRARPARPGSPASMARGLRRVLAASRKPRLGSTSTIAAGNPLALPTPGTDGSRGAATAAKVTAHLTDETNQRASTTSRR
jgi:hypothetical protein